MPLGAGVSIVLPIDDLIRKGHYYIYKYGDEATEVAVETSTKASTQAAKHIDEGVGVCRVENVRASTAGSRTYRSFTAGNFRENLVILTGKNPLNTQAHHVFPQKQHLAEQFAEAGIDINDPRHGAWWDATKGVHGNHSSMAKSYNDDWDKFFFEVSNPTKEQILNQGRDIAEKYGFEVYY